MGIIAVLLVLAMGILSLGKVYAARAQASAIADLAALAGADLSAVGQWEPVGPQACERAGEVVAANGARVVKCWVEGADLALIINKPTTVWQIPMNIQAQARAGPASENRAPP